MASDSKQNLKTLRVDNWALFFLQRLQLMFAKGDCCDLTLKFHTGQELKVHRLVLITCTSFFEDMQKDGDVISMPETLPYSVVQPIINFLYSGKLEFKSELHPQLLNISKSLNITILAKLLITQKNDNGVGVLGSMKQEDGKKNAQRTFLATRIGPSPSKALANKKLPIWRQRAFPLFKPPERRMVKEEEPKPRRFEWPDGKEPNDCLLLTSPSFTPLSYQSENVFTPPKAPKIAPDDDYLPPPLPQSSLKRPAPHSASPLPDKFFKPSLSDDSIVAEPKEEEEEDGQMSGRGDQGDFSDDDDGHFETIHSFGDSDDEQEVEQAPSDPVSHSTPKAVPTTSVAPQPSTVVPQGLTSQISTVHHTYSSSKQLQLPATPSTAPTTKAIETTPISALTTTPLAPKPILKPNAEPLGGTSSAKKVRFSIADDDTKVVQEAAPKLAPLAGETEIQLKAQAESVAAPVSVPSSELVNKAPLSSIELVQLPAPQIIPQESPVCESQPPPVATPTPISVPAPAPPPATPSTSSISISQDSAQATKPASAVTYSSKTKPEKKSTVSPTNHAKIIAEVLKKYPELVKNNKNIRLKISAPGTTNVTNTLTLDTKRFPGRAAYMVVKSTVKTENSTKSTKCDYPTSSFVTPTKTYVNTTTAPSTAAGPWSCSTCNKTGESMVFNNYYDYRVHFQDVHNQKFDSRTCEHCGYKTSKRNLLLYHLFTKHDVPPPKNICFPKCEQCGYVALSEGLLQKHVITHKNMPKEWPCPRCNTILNTYPSLQNHLTTCKLPETVQFICSCCSQAFGTSEDLDTHISVCPGNTSSGNDNLQRHIYEETVEERVEHDEDQQAVEMIEVPIMDTNTITNARGEHSYVQLPNGLILIPADNQPHAMLRHSSNLDGNDRREMVMTSVSRPGYHRSQAGTADVQLLTASGSGLDQMAVAQNVALLQTTEGEDLNSVRNSMGAPLGLTVALPQDHVILLDANSEFFIQGNDSVVVSRMNNATDEYIVPEVLEENIHQLYSSQAIPYSVTTTAGNMIACPVLPMQSTGIVKGQTDKPDDSSGNTVVRVQDQVEANELDTVHIQHHVDESDIESIIVHDSASENEKLEQQQRCVSGTPVDIYVEDPQPPRHPLTINKELMEVVAMEVQRSPNLMGHSSVVVSLPQESETHETVLRSALTQNQSTRCVQSSSVSTSSESFPSTYRAHRNYSGHAAPGSSREANPVIVSEDLTETTMNNVGTSKTISAETMTAHNNSCSIIPNESQIVNDVIEVDSDSDIVEKVSEEQVAKADSLVRDWGFDAEEEGEDATNLNDDDDSSDDTEGAMRTGPSRVTVEL